MCAKGNLVNIPEPGCGCDGDGRELRDTGESPGQSFLFCLTVGRPGIKLLGEGA